MNRVLQTLLECFNSKKDTIVSITGSGAALKIFLLHWVFNLICIYYANYNVIIDRIITKEIVQARTFFVLSFSGFLCFVSIYFFDMCFRERGKQMNPAARACHSKRKSL